MISKVIKRARKGIFKPHKSITKKKLGHGFKIYAKKRKENTQTSFKGIWDNQVRKGNQAQNLGFMDRMVEKTGL